MNEPTQWEYKVEEHDSEQLMNLCGREGWELVSVVAAVYSFETVWRCYFKRPLVERHLNNQP